MSKPKITNDQIKQAEKLASEGVLPRWLGTPHSYKHFAEKLRQDSEFAAHFKTDWVRHT